MLILQIYMEMFIAVVAVLWTSIHITTSPLPSVDREPVHANRQGDVDSTTLKDIKT